MIKISIVRDKTGFITQFVIKGHAGFAGKGNDIVCAAVSAVAYTAVGSLGDLAGIENCYREKDGYMFCCIPGDITYEQKHIAGIILETAAIGLKQIENSYRKYVLVVDEEV